jgi:hypothetical protein
MRFSYRMVPEVYQLFWAAMANYPRTIRHRERLPGGC